MTIQYTVSHSKNEGTSNRVTGTSLMVFTVSHSKNEGTSNSP